MLPLTLPFVANLRTMELRAVQATAQNAYENLQRLWGYLSQYEERFVTLDSGERVMIMARRAGGGGETLTDYLWFATDDITVNGAFRIRVGPGRFSCTEVTGIDSDPPTVAQFVREVSVAGGEFSVTNGSSVYLKITAAQLDSSLEYDNEGQSPADPAGGPTGGATYTAEELITVTVTNKGRVFYALSGEIVVTSTPPTGDATTGYILLTDIEIAGKTMTIKRRRRSVDIGTITGVYGGPVVVDANTEDQLTCVSGEEKTCTYLARTSPD